jgi:hypothetical protein
MLLKVRILLTSYIVRKYAEVDLPSCGSGKADCPCREAVLEVGQPNIRRADFIDVRGTGLIAPPVG